MSDVVFGLKKDVDEFNKLHPNRKLLILILSVALFIISLIVGAIFLRPQSPDQQTNIQNTNTQQNLANKPDPSQSTILKLNPSEGNIKAGESQNIDVMLEGSPATAVDIVLEFDPESLTISDIENGGIYTRVIRSEIADTQIVYSATISPEEATPAKQGIIFSFTATPKKSAVSTESIIRFNSNQSITALNGKNTLGSKSGGIYRIN